MRNLSCCRPKWDKKYFFAFLITLVCSIICGIALCDYVTRNEYLRNLACDYIFNVFNFKNSALIVPHILGDILYFYIFFLIGYFTKFKYLTLIFLFLRGIFFGVYVVLLVCVNSFGGVIVTVFVFVPATLISVAVCYLLVEFGRCWDNKLVFAVPAALALIDCIVLLLLINLVFRVVIIIV